jgi:chloramphenicol O-acetyltransferase type A
MKHNLDIETWNRKEHFNFFKQFDEPYYGVTVNLDCTRAYLRSKELGVSFYNYYFHKTLTAINQLENFRYRIENNQVVVYDQINASATILREDHTFGFSSVKYSINFEEFNQDLLQEIARVKQTTGLFTADLMNNIIHFSALPWVNFTSLSHAFSLKSEDSCPKISIGKLVQENGRRHMPFSLHVHHALVDGYHVGLFFEKLQLLLNE